MAEQQSLMRRELVELQELCTHRAKSIAKAHSAIQLLAEDMSAATGKTNLVLNQNDVFAAEPEFSDLSCIVDPVEVPSFANESPEAAVAQMRLQESGESDTARLDTLIRKLGPPPSPRNCDASPNSIEEKLDTPQGHNSHEAPRTGASKAQQKQNSCLRQIVSGKIFERACLMVILVQASLMGVAAQIDLDSLPRMERIFKLLDTVCVTWYILEVAIKLFAFRLTFFTVPDWRWNIFDLLCVLPIPTLIDLVASRSSTSNSNVGFIRILRIFKMAKMLRVIRVMRFFRELRLLLYTIVGTMTTLFWTLIMLALVMYVFGIVIMQGTQVYLLDVHEGNVDQANLHEDLLKYWGNIGRTMLSLYMALTGGLDWSTVADPLQATGQLYYLVFLIYIAMLQLAILNILIGIFCEVANQVAARDIDTVLEEETAKTQSYASLACVLFEELDTLGTGTITWPEFEKHSHDPRMRQYFNALDIEPDNAQRLFHALGGDDGEVEIEEFVSGCVQVKGDAKRKLIANLTYQWRSSARRSVCLMSYLEDTLHEIFPRLVHEHLSRPPPVKSLKKRLKAAKVPLCWQQIQCTS